MEDFALRLLGPIVWPWVLALAFAVVGAVAMVVFERLEND